MNYFKHHSLPTAKMSRFMRGQPTLYHTAELESSAIVLLAVEPKDVMNKIVDDICSIMRKPGNKNVDGTPNRGSQASVMAQENLRLADFLFYYSWRCIIEWKVMKMQEETAHKFAHQWKLDNKYKNQDVLPKVNKAQYNEDYGPHQRIYQITLQYWKSTSCLHHNKGISH